MRALVVVLLGLVGFNTQAGEPSRLLQEVRDSASCEYKSFGGYGSHLVCEYASDRFLIRSASDYSVAVDWTDGVKVRVGPMFGEQDHCVKLYDGDSFVYINVKSGVPTDDSINCWGTS